MKAERKCWWCGLAAEVDTSLPESNGLIRDDSRMDGGESWMCADNAACVARAIEGRFGGVLPAPEGKKRRSDYGRTRPGTSPPGPRMHAIARYIAANPGCSKSDAARCGPTGAILRADSVERLIRRRFVHAERGPNGHYRLFLTAAGETFIAPREGT
jgi:hypothetical protein